MRRNLREWIDTVSQRRCGKRLATLWRWLRPPLLVLGLISTAMTSALLISVYMVPYDTSHLDDGGPVILLDAHGELLRSVPAPNGRPGRHNWVGLHDIPPAAVMAIVSSEDHHFFEHRGVDGLGILRAAWLNIRARRGAYGASTITMQLVRMIHHRGKPRTLRAKIAEITLALRLERSVDKNTILEHYINRAYYGHGAYGINAAAQRYFGKPARSLSVSEATLLAVIPRAPTAYDPIKRLPATRRRQGHVLNHMVKRNLLSRQEARRAIAQPIAARLHERPFRAPHFTDWVLKKLPRKIKQAGATVHTTLDLQLQEQLEHRVAEHVAGLKHRKLDQAGVVVVDTATGAVLAMVGSARYDGDDGTLNIVTRRRHPGSALKPFVYALALEAGDNPASIAYDVHSVPSAYRALGKSHAEHGPVRYREALAGSYNLAAIHVLEQVGIERMMTTLRHAGIGPLDGAPRDYGLRLALGSAKVRLLDLAAAYGFLVKNGHAGEPVAITRAVDDRGHSVWSPPAPRTRRLFSAHTSWLVMDMLADAEARRKAFGQELPLDLPFRVAAKTGTSRGFADTVTIAVTQEVTVAAWAGNFDGTPTQGLVAMTASAPLVRAAMLLVAGRTSLTLPESPAGIATAPVCALSGLRPGPHCPHHKREYFTDGQQPKKRCSWHQDGGAVRYPPELSTWASTQADHRLHSLAVKNL